MLSRHSFNALLKTLEEPPEHVKFLLATTDPQKLPVTVLSRCLQFNLKALSKEDIAGQLQHVLQQEGISADSTSLSLLARAAKGSMRDALSLTDQAIAQGHGEVLLDSVRQMLGNVPTADIAGLLKDVLNNDAASLMRRVDAMVAVVPDLSSVLVEMQNMLHQLAIMQQLPDAQQAFDDAETLKPLLRQMPAELIQVFYRIVLEGRREQPYAVDARSGLEMTLLRLLAFRPKAGPLTDETNGEETSGEEAPLAAELSKPNEHSGAPEPELKPELKPEYHNDRPTLEQPPEINEEPVSFGNTDEFVDSYEPTPDVVEQSEPHKQVTQQSSNNAPEPEALPQENPDASSLDELLQMRQDLMQKKKPDEVASKDFRETPQTQVPRAPQALKPEESKPESVASAEILQGSADTYEQPHSSDAAPSSYDYPEITDEIKDAADIDRWSAMIAGMDISGLARQVLLNSELQDNEGDNWTILVNSDQQSLLNNATEQAVRESLQGLLGSSALVSFAVGTPANPTPLMLQQRINEYRHKRALERLEKDNGVMELKKRFGAQIDEESVQAL